MDLTERSGAEILAVVDPIMDNLMDAPTSADYERHVRDFTNRAKSVLPKELLQSICKEYQKGFFAKRKFVAAFRRPDSIAVVWRQWFTKHPGEFVAELVLVQSSSRYLVDHVMVF